MMGLFTGLKAILGGADVIKETVKIAGDTVRATGTWIDEQQYTTEEKAKAWQESVATYLKWVELTSTENSLWRVTRRWLAWAIVGEIILLANVSVILVILGQSAMVEQIIAVANAFWLGEGVTAVLVTYFGAGLLRIGKGE